MARKKAFVLGLDFGTNSARALVVDPANGKEVATAVADYPSGAAIGVIMLVLAGTMVYAMTAIVRRLVPADVQR